MSLPPSKSHSSSPHVLFPPLLKSYIVSKVYQKPQPMPCWMVTRAPNSQNILYFTWYFSSLCYLIMLCLFWPKHELLRAGCLPSFPQFRVLTGRWLVCFEEKKEGRKDSEVMIFRRCFWRYANILHFIKSQVYKKVKIPHLPQFQIFIFTKIAPFFILSKYYSFGLTK